MGLEREGSDKREERENNGEGKEGKLFHFPWEGGSDRGRDTYGYGQRFVFETLINKAS